MSKKNSNPLTNLVEYIHVLTLPVFPRRRARIRDHLVMECGIDESRIIFHQGEMIDSVVERFADQEMSIWDILTLNPSILNDNVAQNIAHNHITMIRKVYESLPSHVQWALFLEDDAKIETDVFTMSQSRWTRRFLTSNTNVDVVMLGCLVYCGNPPFPASVYMKPYIVKNISRTLTTHAYILTRTGMEKVLHYADSALKSEKLPPFDHIFHDGNMQVYTMFPMVCHPCREPGMYRRFQMMVTPCQLVSFRQITETMMILSLIFPMFLVIIFLWTTVLLGIRLMKWKKSGRLNSAK